MKNFDVVKDGEKEDRVLFEEKILEIVRELEEELSSTVSVEYAVTRSFGMSLAPVNSDILKLQIAFILILSYATFMLSKGGEGCVRSRVFISDGSCVHRVGHRFQLSCAHTLVSSFRR